MKKMIKIAFVAAFAAIAGYGVYANQKSEVLSDLTLANVEALADVLPSLWSNPLIQSIYWLHIVKAL